jgi:uncharacterized protein (DUF433 family)
MGLTEVTHIVRTAGICGGKPRVDGTRIRVWDIYVWHELQGLSADEIVARFPQLSHGDVYAALAHYWDHRREIDREMQEADAFVEAMRASTQSLLDQKLKTDKSDADSIPPG